MHKVEVKKEGEKLLETPYCHQPLLLDFLTSFLEKEGYEINVIKKF